MAALQDLLKREIPVYTDPNPLPSQFEVPFPGGSGKVFQSTGLGDRVYFYFKVTTVILTAVFMVFITNITQILSTPLYLVDKAYFRRALHYTEELFGTAMVGLHQLFAPTSFVLYKDPSIEKPLFSSSPDNPTMATSIDDFKAKLDLPERLILISNHQLYSDWIYIWCLSYFARRHGDLKIIAKKSLATIPLFGWVSITFPSTLPFKTNIFQQGMWFFDFIFLERNWAKDEGSFMESMSKIASNLNPMWLLIFPEGTTLSAETRDKSTAFAVKNNYPFYKHTLLPRSLGLYKSIESLRDSVEYMYDLTVGIPGVKPGKTPQYTFTLAAMYVMGMNPSQIHVHMRRFKTSEIPRDEEKFGEWLRERWAEKDELLDHFYIHGCFPADVDHLPSLLNISLRHIVELLQFPALFIPVYLAYQLLRFILGSLF